jgi:demethylmenaquinone methyltransferase/2-methoxy-6-polyprenyl-1,4-benzoquinol methylase
MPFRATFECLWCGAAHTTRTAGDIEGWAQLCPACVGRAGENGFLRYRLRAALEERGRARVGEGPVGAAADAGLIDYYEARAAEYDDWYLRRGRYAHGPIDDVAWAADLDAATLWLDRLPWHGRIVELAAGTGWWSPLLAARGELTLSDAADAPLDRARDRLLAHGLRAHIHRRDAWADPDGTADGLFTGFWLSHVERPALGAFLALVRRWLAQGGLYAFIDSRPDPASGVVDGLAGPAPDRSRRRLADGRTYEIPKIHYTPDELHDALVAAGFADIAVTTTSRFFVLGQGLAPAAA